jgi:hypothetical protein
MDLMELNKMNEWMNNPHYTERKFLWIFSVSSDKRRDSTVY